MKLVSVKIFIVLYGLRIAGQQRSHVWTIKGFSQCECRYLETSAKIRDLTQVTPMPMPPPTSTPNVSAATLEPPMLTFRIRLHPQGNKESNKDFSFFQKSGTLVLILVIFLKISCSN
ncbi:hypothetical protein ANCCEY_00344 [Ancylostoma ceylanicum]|uniref:Uncharacterized protein n=1 Tax=Ancylostoma ceylanicum TaxID=53326 RepID=A0A0D6M922_9BILA|nr:hypothetical protein ANCCEY_00344 [Ancylostoma ceylanicum]